MRLLLQLHIELLVALRVHADRGNCQLQVGLRVWAGLHDHILQFDSFTLVLQYFQQISELVRIRVVAPEVVGLSELLGRRLALVFLDDVRCTSVRREAPLACLLGLLPCRAGSSFGGLLGWLSGGRFMV